MAGSLFDKLKEKLPLDKLKNIKVDLPFLKKKKAAEESSADSDAPNKKQPDVGISDKNTHLSDKTDPGVPAGDKTEAEVNVDGLAGPEKKLGILGHLKGRKLSPVKIIVILCVLYLIYDTLLGEPEPEEPAPVAVEKPKRKKRNKNPDAVATEGAVAEGAAATPAPAETPTPTTSTADNAVEAGTLPGAEAGGTPLPKEDNIDVAATPTPSAETTPAVADATPTPEPTSNPLEGLNLDDINKEADQNEKKQEEKVAETPTPTPEATSSTPSLSDIAEDKSETGEAKEKTEKKKDGDIADDLLKNIKDESTPSSESSTATLKQTDPPDYLKTGRGLVYNCKGKHWACLSRDQYTQCKNNRLWNEQNDKSSECHDVSVYATEKDCSTAQRIKIDSLAKTSFCK